MYQQLGARLSNLVLDPASCILVVITVMSLLAIRRSASAAWQRRRRLRVVFTQLLRVQLQLEVHARRKPRLPVCASGHQPRRAASVSASQEWNRLGAQWEAHMAAVTSTSPTPRRRGASASASTRGARPASPAMQLASQNAAAGTAAAGVSRGHRGGGGGSHTSGYRRAGAAAKSSRGHRAGEHKCGGHESASAPPARSLSPRAGVRVVDPTATSWDHSIEVIVPRSAAQRWAGGDLSVPASPERSVSPEGAAAGAAMHAGAATPKTSPGRRTRQPHLDAQGDEPVGELSDLVASPCAPQPLHDAPVLVAANIACVKHSGEKRVIRWQSVDGIAACRPAHVAGS